MAGISLNGPAFGGLEYMTDPNGNRLMRNLADTPLGGVGGKIPFQPVKAPAQGPTVQQGSMSATRSGMAPVSSQPPQAAAHNPALDALIAQLSQQQQPYSAAQAPVVHAPSPATSAAQAGGDAAMYGQAKERGALATKAAMKGLTATLASRGVGSESGVGASEIADLYKTGLTTLADTDRGIAEQGAGRVFQADQADADRTAQQYQYNTTQQNQAAQYARDSRLRQLSLLASLY